MGVHACVCRLPAYQGMQGELGGSPLAMGFGESAVSLMVRKAGSMPPTHLPEGMQRGTRSGCPLPRCANERAQPV